jgi:hypothetical protein
MSTNLATRTLHPKRWDLGTRHSIVHTVGANKKLSDPYYYMTNGPNLHAHYILNIIKNEGNCTRAQSTKALFDSWRLLPKHN